MNKHTTLKSNTIFCPALSVNAIKKAGKWAHVYAYMRADYHSFVYQDMKRQEQGQEYDNTLTCYNKTNPTLAKELGVSLSTIERASNHLIKEGLVIALPFTANGDERRNLVVVDPELEGYTDILNECMDYLNTCVSQKRRVTKCKKQIALLETFTKGELLPPWDYPHWEGNEVIELEFDSELFEEIADIQITTKFTPHTTKDPSLCTHCQKSEQECGCEVFEDELW